LISLIACRGTLKGGERCLVVVWFFKLIQPAVSTCFTFTSLISKVGYFWKFYCKRYPNDRHVPSWSSSRRLWATFRPGCYYWNISCNRTNIFFSIICTYCLIQIILNVNLSKKVRRYLKSGKHLEKFCRGHYFFIEHFLHLIVPNFVRIS